MEIEILPSEIGIVLQEVRGKLPHKLQVGLITACFVKLEYGQHGPAIGIVPVGIGIACIGVGFGNRQFAKQGGLLIMPGHNIPLICIVVTEALFGCKLHVERIGRTRFPGSVCQPVTFRHLLCYR